MTARAANARRYDFETVFAPDGTVLREAGGRKIIFSEAEVAAEREAAYAAGRQDATARAGEEIARAIDALAGNVAALLRSLEAEARALREEAALTALAGAKAIAGAALDRFGAERVEAVLAEALDGLRAAPRLVVRLPEAQSETLAPHLARLADEHGFAGALVVRPDAALAAGDVSLEWGEGAVRLDRADAAARVEEIIMRALRDADGA